MLEYLLALQIVFGRPGQSFNWDYDNTKLTEFMISRFELQLDATPYIDVGLVKETATATTTTFRAPIPAMPFGRHVASVRACNIVECGEPLILEFNYSAKPDKPLTLTIK